MAWMRAVSGRLKSDYRYSKDVVYNNFPWPTPTDAQKAKIEQTAQAILDSRALYPDCSLADLYDEVTMPPELRRAHQQNDRAVMEAYGMPIKGTTESTCVAELMRRYQALTAGRRNRALPTPGIGRTDSAALCHEAFAHEKGSGGNEPAASSGFWMIGLCEARDGHRGVNVGE